MAKQVFTLRIELGNDAMQTAEDVAAALHNVAYRVEQHGGSVGIRDDNGNNVGYAQFQQDPRAVAWEVLAAYQDGMITEAEMRDALIRIIRGEEN